MPSDDPCHPDYKPSLNMGYPTCTEAAALRNLAQAERASRRTQESETSLTSHALESTCAKMMRHWKIIWWMLPVSVMKQVTRLNYYC